MILTLKVPSIPDGTVSNREFSNKLNKVIHAGHTHEIIFDFDDVPVITSMTMGIIVSAIKECQVQFKLINISDMLLEEFKVILGQEEIKRYFHGDKGNNIDIEVKKQSHAD